MRDAHGPELAGNTGTGTGEFTGSGVWGGTWASLIPRRMTMGTDCHAAYMRTLHERTARLERDLMAALKREDGLRGALIWCSGSPDFGEGGQARVGWLKLCAPLLDAALEPAAPATETRNPTAAYDMSEWVKTHQPDMKHRALAAAPPAGQKEEE